MHMHVCVHNKCKYSVSGNTVSCFAVRKELEAINGNGWLVGWSLFINGNTVGHDCLLFTVLKVLKFAFVIRMGTLQKSRS